MKWVLLAVLLIGLALLALGYIVERSGGSNDEKVGSVLPYLLGLMLIGLDMLAGLVWAIAT